MSAPTKFRILTCYDPNAASQKEGDGCYYLIQSFVFGRWMNCKDKNGPISCRSHEEAKAKLKEVKATVRALNRGLLTGRRKGGAA